MLFKISKTTKAKHIGTYHYDMINAKYAKDKAGSEYHIYQKVKNISGGTSWIKVM